MEKRVRSITYKDKEILYFDHQGLIGMEIVNNIKDANKFIMSFKSNELLTLANFKGVFITEEVMKMLKSDEVVETQKKVKKVAVLGIVGIKKIFLNVVNKVIGEKARAFNTEEEAKEWLVKD